MPADRLTTMPARGPHPRLLEEAVLDAIGGTSIDEAAATAGITPAQFAKAIDRYRQAGRQALANRRHRHHWTQINIAFADPDKAETLAARRLLPALSEAETSGAVTSWWWLRKHPGWRLRIRTLHPDTDPVPLIAPALLRMGDRGELTRWSVTVYEPETAAFGGPAGLDAAHTLFAATSHAILTQLQPVPGRALPGRRELALLIAAHLHRAARLEPYERGDVWDRVARDRPLPDDVPPERMNELAADARALLSAVTELDEPLIGPHGQLTAAADWASSAGDAGRALADAARDGTLERGLRAVLAYCTIFTWNQLGLPARPQCLLAHAARNATLHTDPPSPPRKPPAPTRRPTSAATKPDPMAPFRKWPLLLQTHRQALPLDERLAEIELFATTASEPDVREERLARACAAWNLAALLAADSGMPDLATHLCLTQFHALKAHWPATGPTIAACLQPLVNLAQLPARAGSPLDTLNAFRDLTPIGVGSDRLQIAGTAIDLHGLTDTSGSRATAVAFLRPQLLTYGTRALITAGLWDQAVMHAAHHDTRPAHLHVHRQARILARLAAKDTRGALNLLDSTTVTAPWGTAIAACLRAHATTGPHKTDMIDAMVTAVHNGAATATPETMLPWTRLTLTAADIADQHGPRNSAATQLRQEATDYAVGSADAYLAAELLEHPTCVGKLSESERDALAENQQRSGLVLGGLPRHYIATISSALSMAVPALTGGSGRRTLMAPRRVGPTRG